jgi:hypothetical protein
MWNSSNNAVASFGSNGNPGILTGQNPGSANVTATFEGVQPATGQSAISSLSKTVTVTASATGTVGVH